MMGACQSLCDCHSQRGPGMFTRPSCAPISKCSIGPNTPSDTSVGICRARLVANACCGRPSTWHGTQWVSFPLANRCRSLAVNARFPYWQLFLARSKCNDITFLWCNNVTVLQVRRRPGSCTRAVDTRQCRKKIFETWHPHATVFHNSCAVCTIRVVKQAKKMVGCMFFGGGGNCI